MPNRSYNSPLRITTGKLNTVNDGSIGAGPTSSELFGVQTLPGQLGRVVTFSAATIAKKWDTSLSAAPATSDITFQYVLMASDAAITPARGVLCFWKDKDAYIVTTTDTGGFEVAGVCLGAKPAVGKYGFIAVRGDVPVKFLATTTKNGSEAAGDVAVSVSGSSGLADVIADATAQTFGTENTDELVGRLAGAITSQIATVSLKVNPNGW